MAGSLTLPSPPLPFHAPRRFPFTRPDRIRDAKGRRPDHPDYDPSTLQLPDGFPKFRTAKGETVTLTAAQEQWWRVKAAHWDCVLMFKVGARAGRGLLSAPTWWPDMLASWASASLSSRSALFARAGKFYELFELHDATVGAQVLGAARESRADVPVSSLSCTTSRLHARRFPPVQTLSRRVGASRPQASCS